MDFAAARKVMVDSQVRVNDVTDRALQAALLAVVGMALMAMPGSADWWPWQLTPLTARAIGAWCIGLAVVAALIGAGGFGAFVTAGFEAMRVERVRGNVDASIASIGLGGVVIG